MTVSPDGKNAMRDAVLRRIGELPAEYIASSDAGIFENLSALPEFISAGVILFYYSVNREPDTRKAIGLALRLGKTVALPISYRGGVMHAHELSGDGELRGGLHGIPAPPENSRLIDKAELELIIVPALAFDGEGFRLGYGGGYYDRYLPGARAYTVGLARRRLLERAVPREPHDIAVRRVITE
ncbi:MAG: 5-formyltetrahydrofolate cyclo-ligase [Oscillospiraceae bacterium]|jgi:5-formyltetrahydrofolate cyclo-ligase|nr:5-formyltetrahydrofolate cyclo-ligase [Oscillospiraceae bacterium]